jgi:hypothetical protein
MKALRAIALSLALFASTSAAQAQSVNMSNLSCKDFLGLKPDAITMLWAWLYGYYADQDAEPVVDFDKLTAKGQAMAQACKQSPDKDIITIAKDIYEK